MTNDQETKCRKAFEEMSLAKLQMRLTESSNYGDFRFGWLACQRHNDAKIKASEEMAKALRELDIVLTIPAAEYVPEITRTWKIIQNALEQWRKANE